MTEAQKQDPGFDQNVAILGGGSIGQALAGGLVQCGGYSPSQVHLTRRRWELLDDFKRRGFPVSSDNAETVACCRTLLLTVQPGQLDGLLDSIAQPLRPDSHIILSAVTGVSIADIARQLDSTVPIVRIMPNLAVAIGQSMTCLAADGRGGDALQAAIGLFDRVGATLTIEEEQMVPATALCACGIAFFLRSIRAASQGGIQIGFHADEALHIAAQTARGAASLLLRSGSHPESEIDRVTTPRGCTIGGLNEMEYEGFSSAMIKGLVTSTRIAASLVRKDK